MRVYDREDQEGEVEQDPGHNACPGDYGMKSAALFAHEAPKRGLFSLAVLVRSGNLA